MAESPARKVIELHFGNKFVLERLPFHGMFGAPAAQASGRFAGKAGRLDEFFQLFR